MAPTVRKKKFSSRGSSNIQCSFRADACVVVVVGIIISSSIAVVPVVILVHAVETLAV